MIARHDKRLKWRLSEGTQHNVLRGPFQYPIRCFNVKSQSQEISNLNYDIILKFYKCYGTSTAEASVKFQNDQTLVKINISALKLCEILYSDIIVGVVMGSRFFLALIYSPYITVQIDGFAQNCGIFSALAVEIMQSSTKSSGTRVLKLCLLNSPLYIRGSCVGTEV